MSYNSDLEMIRTNPCARYKLKEAIEAFDKLDPVDALHDAQVLLGFCEKRCKEIGLTASDPR